jgi:hypothetical protein
LARHISLNGFYSGNTSASHYLDFRSDSVFIATFRGNGNVGIGVLTPVERIDMDGNLKMNSTKGILLNNVDRPFITRGFDQFASGTYAGLGRWGLFMEPSRVTIGFPDLPGKGFKISSYSDNSNISKDILVINNDGDTDVYGKVTRSNKTGSANLLPFAYGTVSGSGSISNGTGNFTVFRSGVGSYLIDFVEFISDASYTVQGSVLRTGGNLTAGPNLLGDIRVTITDLSGTLVDRDFSFVVYNPN